MDTQGAARAYMFAAQRFVFSSGGGGGFCESKNLLARGGRDKELS
jgi:hypothetical protein